MCVKLTHTKKGLSSVGLAADEILCARGDVVVDGHHAFAGQRTGVFAHLLADLAETGIDCRVVFCTGLAVHHAPRPVLGFEGRVLRVVVFFGLLLRVQVVEVAVELVEAVHRGQKLVAIAEVVLAKLPGRVALVLEELSNRRVLVA